MKNLYERDLSQVLHTKFYPWTVNQGMKQNDISLSITCVWKTRHDKNLGYDFDFPLLTWYHNYFVHLGFGMIMYSVLLNDKHVITKCNIVFFLTWSKNPYRKTTRYQIRSLFICVLEFYVFRQHYSNIKGPILHARGIARLLNSCPYY